MSTSKELERLRNTRIKLEEDSRSLLEQQKNFEETIKTLEEKIAIEEQKNRNRETRDAISQLESKIKELEQKLKETSETPKPPGPTLETTSEIPAALEPEKVTVESDEPKLAAEEETEDENVTVAPLGEPMTVGQEYGENLERTRDKKKRKFF